MRHKPLLELLACCGLALALSASFLFPITHGTDALDFRYFEFLFDAFRAEVLVFKEFPAWNPYACGGYPLHANPQSCFLSPFAWPALLIGSVPGLKFYAFAHILVALSGALFLGRALSLASPARWLLAITFGGSARFAWILQGGQIAMLTYAYFPWLLTVLIRAEKDLRYALVAGAIFALMVFGGGTSGVPLAVLLLIVYAFLRLVLPNHSFCPLLAVLVAFASGLLLSLPKVWPMLVYLLDHPRVVSPQDDSLTLTQVARMFFERRASKFMIDFAREPHLLGLHYRWWGEYGSYVGPIIPGLSAVALASRRKETALWAVALLIFGAFMLGDGGPYTLLRQLPIYRDLRVPSRFSILVVLMLALLAAHGLHALHSLLSSRRSKVFSWVIFALIALDMGVFFHQVTASISKRPTQSATFSSFLLPVVHSGTSLSEGVQKGFVSLDCYDPMFEAAGYKSPAYNRLVRMRAPVEAPSYAQIRLIEWSPNRIEFLLTSERETKVLVRQNFDRGWSSSHGKVIDDQGLLAVILPKGTHVVTLDYSPPGLRVGFVVMGLSAIFLIFLARKFPRRDLR